MTKSSNNQGGFTLIEMLVVIFVFCMIAGGIIALVSSILTNSSKQQNLLYDADQARRVSFQIMRELRNAQVSNTGAYPVSAAGAQQLTFYSNLDGGVPIERVRYFIQSGILKKGILTPTGNPLAYVPANEIINNVQGNVANQAIPLFYYHGGDYNGDANTFIPQPVDVTDVRYVRLNLLIYNKGGSGNSFYTVSAGGSLRNLKSNLGD